MSSMEKMKSPWFLAILIIIFCLSLPFGFVTGERGQKIIPVIQITKPLQFDLSGTAGYFRETEPAVLKAILGAGHYRLQFNASSFSYLGKNTKKKYELAVVFWVDNQKNIFTPDKPLVLHIVVPESGNYQTRSYQMLVYGGVNIQNISDQPAGQYEGKISVQVSEEN